MQSEGVDLSFDVMLERFLICQLRFFCDSLSPSFVAVAFEIEIEGHRPFSSHGDKRLSTENVIFLILHRSRHGNGVLFLDDARPFE